MCRNQAIAIKCLCAFLTTPCWGKNHPKPLVGHVNAIVPTMGYRLPPYWNAPFEGKVDPFLIRPFDPCYDPYTWTANTACVCTPSHPSNWGTDSPPPNGKRSLTRAQSTEQLCQKPFYMDIHSECNRDYRCTPKGPHVWDDNKKHYVCTPSAMQSFKKNQSTETTITQDLSKMFCHS